MPRQIAFPVFDSNVHLPAASSTDDSDSGNTVNRIEQELNCSVDDCIESMNNTMQQLASGTSAANIMIFNQDFADDDGKLKAIFKASQQQSIPLSLTMLLDFRDPQVETRIHRIRDAGFRAIKFHSYIQSITDSDLPMAVRAADHAEACGLVICIDTSYGGLDMYRCDNLKLAAAIAASVKTTPIVLLHSGGARILEAMLLAESQGNVFLETSFSLSYYQGSSVDDDMAFAYQKIGCQRVLYGSDHPYIAAHESLRDTLDFFEKHGFSATDQEQVVGRTALKLFGPGS